ncbi:MAG TPA: hypothetical protein VHK70_11015 [Burkholderiaceae bacterium]|jgi:Flp pilus assembly pilin Flp|nr:hypothetical protein [Burkholderiaceae bacterium]
MQFVERLPQATLLFLREEGGASLTEYVLFAALIAMVCGIAWLAWNKGA